MLTKIEVGDDLEPRDARCGQVGGDDAIVHQPTIDAEANAEVVAARFKVNVGRSLSDCRIECASHQPRAVAFIAQIGDLIELALQPAFVMCRRRRPIGLQRLIDGGAEIAGLGDENSHRPAQHKGKAG